MKRVRLRPWSLLRMHSIRKGLLGGSTAWTVVGVMVWAPRLMRRLFGRTEQVVATERLKPGQFVSVTAIPTPTRRQRKAQRKAARSAK